MSRRIAVPVGILLVAVPLRAEAANALRPRTPATFPADTPCVQTVEMGEVLHIDYGVPMDDVDLTDDELPDSRQLQFFAFARQRFDFRPPFWINQSDYDRARENGDVAQYEGFPILESDPQWPAGTWMRITPDDARVPITMEQAAKGVDWDTTGTPPGTWVVAAYTWEPEQNLWSHRFGAVRVVDPADPDATGPTVFLQFESGPVANEGEPYAPSGCIEAPEGSVLTASWGRAGGMEPQWVPFAEDVPVTTGPLDLEFVAPAEAVGSVKLRVEITDPEGRSYTAYSPAVIAVLGSSGEGDDGSADGGEDAGDSGGGGGCRLGSDAPVGASALAFVVLVAARRRRH